MPDLVYSVWALILVCFIVVVLLLCFLIVSCLKSTLRVGIYFYLANAMYGEITLGFRVIYKHLSIRSSVLKHRNVCANPPPPHF